MTPFRLALVADDTRLAGTILAHIRRCTGLALPHCGLDDARRYLVPDMEGLIILAAGAPADADRVARLVHEARLQKLPTSLTLLEAAPSAPGRGLAGLGPHLSHRLRWPDDAERLVSLLREMVAGLPAPEQETLEDRIARGLSGQTPSLVPLVERLALAAEHDVTVLLTGETGTGKTHLARLLHDHSPRARAPFLAVPCGAVPANLVESTFFGHVKGAFTGATERKAGKFEAAGEGTILLDEIDTLPLEQQASLLRVIETGEYEAVGSNETRRCRARILVASNWDLEEAVRQARFREDLYYRLNVMSFHLPALRERRQDIAPLARAMAGRFNTRFKKELFDISSEALALLEWHPWPGNIRQLENVMQQAVLLSSGPLLKPEHLPPAVREGRPAAERREAPPAETLKDNREATEKTVIQKALATNGNSRSRAANALGISRVTLYKKMKKYGLMP
jgi:DNA-binding NtrC family response regulator